jgi:hypothetical protein
VATIVGVSTLLRRATIAPRREDAGARRDRSVVLSPVVFFPSLWVLGVLLASLAPLPHYDLGAWSADAWIVMVAVPVVFVLGCVMGRNVTVRRLGAGDLPPRPELETDAVRTPRPLRLTLGAAVTIGYAELAHQFAGAGGIPILSANIDATRVAQPGGLSIILLNLLPVAAILALASRRSLRSRDAAPEVLIAAVAVAGFVLSGGRGTVVLAIVAAAIARGLLYGVPRATTLIASGMVVVALLTGTFFLRTAQHKQNPFEHTLYTQTLPAMPAPLRPYAALHFGYATNFDVLARVVRHFPSSEPYGHGAFSTSGFDRVIPGTRRLGSVTAQLTSPWVTSTLAGPFWADGGLPFVVIGITLIGAVAGAAHAAAVRRRSLITCAVAGYLLYMTAFGVYTNLWTDHPDWAFALPALGLLGTVGSGRSLWRRGRSPDQASGRARTRYSARVRHEGRRVMRSSPLSRLHVSLRPFLSRKPLIVCLAALVAIFGIAVAVELLRDEKPADAVVASPLLSVSERFTLAGAVVGANSTIATDGDLSPDSDNSQVWSFRGGGGGATVERLDFADTPPRSTRMRVDLGPSSPNRALDVGQWATGTAVFVMRLERRGIRSQVTSLGVRPRVESRGFSVLPAPSGKREVAIATWSGALPDLFVLDWLGARERLRVTVFSGESAFRARIVSAHLPLMNPDPQQWSFDVGRVLGQRPSVVGVNRAGTGSGHPEVHILTGDSGFKQFGLQRPVRHGKLSGVPRFVTGLSLSQPSVFLVDGRDLLVVPVAPRR